NELGEVARQRALEVQALPAHRVYEGQFGRMQSLSTEGLQRSLGPPRQVAAARLEACSVDFIPEQRVADVSQVHADLMCASGLQRKLEQAGKWSAFAPAKG